MFICKNPACSRSYLSDDGQIVTNLVRALRRAHNRPKRYASFWHIPHALGQLAPRIYQNGELACAGCGQNNLAHHTAPGEPADVNTLLENIEVLQLYDILPDAA